MRIEALVCVQCGGPLGGVTAIPALVECEFCGAAISVGQASATIARPGSADELRAAKQREANKAFLEALIALLKAGKTPHDALREASAAHLGAAGRTDALARVTLALATDFERQSGATVLRDPMVLSRIAQAYLGVVEKLATSPREEINLPFVAATPQGPVHFQRSVTAAELAQLAERDPDAAAPAEGRAKTKKGWWPFGG